MFPRYHFSIWLGNKHLGRTSHWSNKLFLQYATDVVNNGTTKHGIIIITKSDWFGICDTEPYFSFSFYRDEEYKEKIETVFTLGRSTSRMLYNRMALISMIGNLRK